MNQTYIRMQCQSEACCQPCIKFMDFF